MAANVICSDCFDRHREERGYLSFIGQSLGYYVREPEEPNAPVENTEVGVCLPSMGA